MEADLVVIQWLEVLLSCSAKTGGTNPTGLASFPGCTGVWKRDLVYHLCYPIQWWWKMVEFRESEAKRSLVSVVNTANYITTNCCYKLDYFFCIGS